MKSFVSFVAIEIYLIVALFFSNPLLSQVITVSGNVTADTIPVRYASIIFTDKSDATKKFSAITDTLGNYQIGIITTVEKNRSIVPSSIELEQNYPNPFSSSTAISYQINKQLDVSIKIYDILGRIVKVFLMGTHGIGAHGIVWDGTDNFGKKVTPGIYFYQMRAGDETLVKKMVFGLAGANVSMAIPKTVKYFTKELKKENKAQIAARSYTVQITNTDSTTLKIVPQQFNDIVIQRDTTLNFVVIAMCPPFEIVPESPYDSPVWHPSGQFIGFNHTPLIKIEYPYGKDCQGKQHFAGDSAGFWLINPDGTNKRRIFRYKLLTSAWSPDGEWIAFGAGAQIYKMRFTGTTFDTTTIVQLTTEGRNFFPAWSPDGLRIAYDRSLADASGPAGVWIMRTDGSQKQFIARGRMPTWAPDGTYLLYIGLWAEIYRVNVSDTSQVTRLTSFNQIDPYTRNNEFPKYSPDGTKIAFWSNGNLWIMDSSGTNLQQLTSDGVDVSFGLPFSWNPDGSSVVYTRYRSDEWTMSNGVLWILNPITGEKKQLTSNP
jgi:Tol biopolymer transport system component